MRATGWKQVAATLAAAALLSACAPHFEKPDIHVVSVGVKSMSVQAQELRVHLKVVNPNGIALPIEGVNYTVLVNGESFARGETAEPITVPPHGASDVEVPVVMDLKGGLGGVLTLGTLLSASSACPERRCPQRKAPAALAAGAFVPVRRRCGP